MKINLPLACWIVALLLVISAFGNALMVFQQVMIYKGIEDAGAKLNQIAADAGKLQAVTQSVVNDLANYSQRQQAIQPILQKYGVMIARPPQPQR